MSAPACPVTLRSVDQTTIRLTAGQIALWLIGFLITHSWLIPAFLTLDFTARLARKPRLSLIHTLSRLIQTSLALAPDPADEAPKRFAATLGLLFSVAVTLLTLFSLTWIAVAVAVVFASCAVVESVFGYCVGCAVYQIIQKLKS